MSLKNRVKQISKKKRNIKGLFNFKNFPIKIIGKPFNWDNKIIYVKINDKFFDKHLSNITFNILFNSIFYLLSFTLRNKRTTPTNIICPICKKGTINLTSKTRDICETHMCYIGNNYEFNCGNKKCNIKYLYYNRQIYC